MALALNTNNPLYPYLTALIGVDTDNVIKDFKTPSRVITPHANVTINNGGYGKGFRVTKNGTYNTYGLTLTTGIPVNQSTGKTLVFVAFNAYVSGTNGSFGKGCLVGPTPTTICYLHNDGQIRTFFNYDVLGSTGKLPVSTFAAPVPCTMAFTRNGSTSAGHRFWINGASTPIVASTSATGAASVGNVTQIPGNSGEGGIEGDIAYIAFFDGKDFTNQEISDLHTSLSGGGSFALLSDGASPASLTSGTATQSSTANGGAIQAGTPEYVLSSSTSTQAQTAVSGSISTSGSLQIIGNPPTPYSVIYLDVIGLPLSINSGGAPTPFSEFSFGASIANLSAGTSTQQQAASSGGITAASIPPASLSGQTANQNQTVASGSITASPIPPTTPADLSGTNVTQSQTANSGAITAYVETAHHLGCTSVNAGMRGFILSVVPPEVEVIQGLSDAPHGDFVAFTSIGLKRLRTNEYHYQGENNTVETQQGMQETFQVDFYGKCSQEQAIAFTTFFRSDFACQKLKPIAAPLYCDEPRMIPLDSGERKYIKRWSVKAHIQINPTFTTPQEFFSVLGNVSASPL